MTKPHRQQYGLGSFVKKIAKKAKKVAKSPLGKAALLGAGAYFAPSLWGGARGLSGWKTGLGALRNKAFGAAAKGAGKYLYSPVQGSGKSGMFSGAWDWMKGNPGKAAMIGAGVGGTLLPFMGGDEEEDIVEQAWDITPDSIANIRKMAKARDPSLAFLPPEESVMSGYYGSKDGGIVGLANGGQPAEAQAEQMLKMEYQKYRNQGGTMSYQQFKMAVLQQAQQQGPMAQGQPQMAANGGRIGYKNGSGIYQDYLQDLEDGLISPDTTFNEWLVDTAPDPDHDLIYKHAKGGRAGYQGGELVEDESMMVETPTGMMEENVEEVQGEPTREQLEVLAMEIFQLRLEELDEEQLMVVYQAAMEQQPQEEMMQEDIQFAAQGGRIGYAGGLDYYANLYSNYAQDMIQAGNTPMSIEDFVEMIKEQEGRAQGGRIGAQEGGVIGSHVRGYTTPPGYNQFDYPSGGVRVGRAEGGLMSLGGMEKDYRNEGGFVALGGEEKADDVPARLSKNEFVFTADAVRNAGGGDIDAGAAVMENVMNHLESGGQISEESQGAQGMYNNMQQLQTRIE